MSTAMAPLDFGAMTQSYLAANPVAQSAPLSSGDSAINMVVGAAEIGGAACLMGYLNARSPAEDKSYHEMFGYPTDVVMGGGLVGLGIVLALFGSKAYAHVLRVGFGCLLEAGVRVGLEKGVADRQSAKTTQVVSGKKAELRLVDQKGVTQVAAGTRMQVAPVQSEGVFQPVR